MPLEFTVSLSDRSRRAEGLLALAAVLLAAVLQIQSVRADLARPATTRPEILTTLALRSLATDGPQLDYTVPVLGQPWQQPDAFGLYHNTSALVARTSGLPVEAAGRWTSLLGFYLGLPALYLLTRRLDGSTGTALLAVALGLGSAYGREQAAALTADSTALTLSCWWLWLFLQNQATPTLLTRLLAAVSGILAAVSGPAVFAVFALAGVVFCPQMQTKRLTLPALALRTAAGLLPPLAALVLWSWHADLLRAANPYAGFLTAHAQWSQALGTMDLRLTGDFWLSVPTLLFASLLSPLAVLVLPVFAGAWTESDRAYWGRLLLVVILPLLVLHPLYLQQPATLGAVVIIACLLIAGLTSRLFHFQGAVIWTAALLILFAQSRLTLPPSPEQRSPVPQFDELTRAAVLATGPRDLVITSGQDWDLAFAYRVDRRCILIPAGQETDLTALAQAVGSGPDWPVGAIILTGRYRDEVAYLAALRDRFHLSDTPVFNTAASDLYVPASSAMAVKDRLTQAGLLTAPTELTAAPLPPASTPTKPRGPSPVPEVTLQSAHESDAFAMMAPRPVRHSVPYDLTAHDINGQRMFFAHAPTVLEFDLSQGATTLAMDFFMPEGAYTGKGDTDGAEVVILLRTPDGRTQEVFRRWFDPVANWSDRDHIRPHLDFAAPAGSTLVVQCLAGPENRANFDWIYISRLEIR